MSDKTKPDMNQISLNIVSTHIYNIKKSLLDGRVVEAYVETQDCQQYLERQFNLLQEVKNGK